MCSVAHPGGPEAKTIPFTSGSMKISKKELVVHFEVSSQLVTVY